MRDSASAVDKAVLEHQILADVFSKTGIRFMRIGGIDTADVEIARKVLPVLESWVDHVQDRDLRRALYSRFVTRHASEYMHSLVRWLQSTEPGLEGNTLAFAIYKAVTSRDAGWLLQALDALPTTDFTNAILARLTSFRSSGEQAAERLLSILNRGEYRKGDLKYLKHSKHPKIIKWLNDNGARTVRPPTLSFANADLHCSRDIISAPLYLVEVDENTYGEALDEITKRFGVVIPEELYKSAIVRNVQNGTTIRWQCASHESVALSFVREDVDIVQLRFGMEKHNN